MRNWAPSLFADLVMAAPVLATPNQNVWTRDTLFAQTPDSVLVLRTITDNHGSYFTTQTDTFLLTLSLYDGSLLDIAPVERSVVQSVGEDSDSITYYPIENAVNPFDVRASLNAAPLDDPHPSRFHRTMLHPRGLLVFDWDELSYRLDVPALREQITTSLVATRAQLPVLYSINGYDVFEPERLTPFGDRIAERATVEWFTLSGPSVPVLVQLYCENEYDGGVSTYWIVVPPVGSKAD